MAKFDPARHRVVAVPYRDDDPERGQHFHVDLDALVDAAREAAAGDVSRETLGDDQGMFLAKRCKQLEDRIAELEARPVVSDDTLKQLNDALHAKLQTLIERQVTAALGDLRSRLVTVERKSTSVTTQQDPDSAKLTRLAAMMHSFGEMVKEIESSVDQRQTDIEQRYAELAEYITDNNIKVMKLAGKLHGAMQALEADDEGKAA
jgi:uncharacterized coiled-coil protein SlyX